MAFILFNTRAKAQHYVEHKNANVHKEWDFYAYHVSYRIDGNRVLRYEHGDHYCSASDPYTGYICCSGNYFANCTVIGRIKS
jgi:hypothetical protein